MTDFFFQTAQEMLIAMLRFSALRFLNVKVFVLLTLWVFFIRVCLQRMDI